MRGASSGRPRTGRSTCSYCGVGCGVRVEVDRKGAIRVEGDPDHPVNRGMLCSKGLNLGYVVGDRSDRLMYPEMRRTRSGSLERVSWDEAITRAAAVFRSIIARHGPDSVGFYVSGQCLTEEYYLANKLVKGFLGTNNIDTNSRLCMSSAVAAHTRMFGEDSVPISYDDIEHADCFLVAGANPAWCHPILFRRIEARKAEDSRVRLIVADPRRTRSCEVADLHLALRPGTDIHLFHAIARVLIETGRVDQEFLDRRVDGYAAYREAVFTLGVGEAARICGVEVAEIVQAAEWIGEADAFLSMWAMGLNQSSVGVDKNLALMSLSLITGQIGRPGGGPFSLTGQPNAMGGREVGGMASLLAAHRELSNPDHREELARFWGVDSIRAEPGLTATEMFEALEDGRLRAIWILGTNPMVSLPNVNRAERALREAPFVVVQEISRRSDTLRHADLILPAAGYLEKDGTMTNSERRISYLEKLVDPPGEALPDAEILMRFGRAMGFHGFDFRSAAEVFEEHARLTAGTNLDIAGLTHAELRRRGSVQWPLQREVVRGREEVGGTARLFTDHRFHTPDGRARLFPVLPPAHEPEPPDREHPLVLTTGRIRDQWHTRTRTGKVSRLNRHHPRPFLEIHPDDARARGIGEGDLVRIENGRGEVRVPARVSPEMRPGTVFLPMHWGRMGDETGARANNLTSDRVDPISKEPDFKFSRVRIERVRPRAGRIAVVGAGAGAWGFVRAFRRYDRSAEIHVLTDEPDPFYDRVLLPEYMSGRKGWDDLRKGSEDEIRALDLHLHTSTRIHEIDRERRVVVDQHGGEHPWDRLVVATGSRAFVPPSQAVGAPGIFTMRTRRDAEALKARMGNGGHVLIVGGGLLGLEMAASLLEMGASVTVVERGSRLMDRQLDPVAAGMLAAYVEDCGVQLHLNDEVIEVVSPDSPHDRNVWVTLRSGRRERCDALAFAIGTRPNVEILRRAGLECGRGAIVDDQLRTSDPAIHAIGEVAEHRGRLHGITAAAEAQAEVVARFLAGDSLARYAGSIPMNILKFPGLDLCSLGIPVVPAGGEGYEEVIVLDRAESYYKKCIVHDDRLVGAILLGDRAEFPDFRDLIDTRLELSSRRGELLRGTAREPVEGPLVCSCAQVGRGNLERRIAEGCTELEELCRSSGAGSGCGSCRPDIVQLLADRDEPVGAGVGPSVIERGGLGTGARRAGPGAPTSRHEEPVPEALPTPWMP